MIGCQPNQAVLKVSVRAGNRRVPIITRVWPVFLGISQPHNFQPNGLRGVRAGFFTDILGKHDFAFPIKDFYGDSASDA